MQAPDSTWVQVSESQRAAFFFFETQFVRCAFKSGLIGSLTFGRVLFE